MKSKKYIYIKIDLSHPIAQSQPQSKPTHPDLNPSHHSLSDLNPKALRTLTQKEGEERCWREGKKRERRKKRREEVR